MTTRAGGGILDELLSSLREDGQVRDVRIGPMWTAVVAEIRGRIRCGLASTLRASDDGNHGAQAPVEMAGRLTTVGCRELAHLIRSESPLETGVGMAAINALLPPPGAESVEINAEAILRESGVGRRVAIIGHFPFVDRLRHLIPELAVLELRPGPGDLPAHAAETVLPAADVVAISGATFVNGTFPRLLSLCRPGATILVVGPSTPLSPVLFCHGVDVLSGVVVDDVQATLRAVSEGATFRQIHRQGVRTVSLQRPRPEPGGRTAPESKYDGEMS